MHTERRVTRHQQSDFITPPINQPDELTYDQRQHQAAQREASQREMDLIRSLNPPHRPRPEIPPLRKPKLDFDGTQIDEGIYERGIAISRDRLVSLGRRRFDELLAADHEARSLQRVIGPKTDLTSFPSVAWTFQALNLFQPVGVPVRSAAEIASGTEDDREQAREIKGFADLWKLHGSEPQTVRRIYGFRDAFESLAFGQSLLERIADDGRVRSRFFCGGKPQDLIGRFQDWLNVLDGPHFVVKLSQPLFHALAWLCQEKQPAPDVSDAVFEGWLRGHTSWSLWNFVGRVTRKPPDYHQLEQRAKDLRQRYGAIQNFFDTIEGYHWQDVGQIRQFETKAHRAYLDRSLANLVDAASLVIARTVSAPPTVARFPHEGWLLCEGRPKEKLQAMVTDALQNAFAGAAFKVEITEVQS
jgi:hypothetical protein